MVRKVRVRFAPSPTGPLHIGGVRTALFNYLFAKANKGDFILRIEDTDQTRFVEGAEKYINKSLEWLGMVPDEGVMQGGNYGPYKQSERKDSYLPLAEYLIENGNAYYAFDTPAELELEREKCNNEKRIFAYDHTVRKRLNNSIRLGPEKTTEKIKSGIPYVIRFKVDPYLEEISINDIIRGVVKFDRTYLDDKVIFKSDGLPTYHLANVADDYAMKISHVIRGEEWLPSLPLHIMLYKALGWENEMPEFAHLPLILKPGGKGKLSKRDGDKEGFPVFPLEWKTPDGEISSGYKESGYFSEAVVNLLALLGWNPGTEQEIFSMEELIKSFSLDKVNKSGARFDPEKAKWFNQQYMQTKSDAELVELFLPVLEQKGVSAEKSYIEKVIGMVKERAVFPEDVWEQGDYFFVAPKEYNTKNTKKFWKEDTPKIVNDCLEILKQIEPFSSTQAEEKVKAYIEENELGFGKVMNPLRLTIVGAGKGPHLFDIMNMIGKEETVKRIEIALERL